MGLQMLQKRLGWREVSVYLNDSKKVIWKTSFFQMRNYLGLQKVFNQKNDRIYSESIESIPNNLNVAPKFQSRPSLMVWAVSACGRSKLVFIKKGQKINASMYQPKILKHYLVNEGCKIFGNKSWCFGNRFSA